MTKYYDYQTIEELERTRESLIKMISSLRNVNSSAAPELYYTLRNVRSYSEDAIDEIDAYIERIEQHIEFKRLDEEKYEDP